RVDAGLCSFERGAQRRDEPRLHLVGCERAFERDANAIHRVTFHAARRMLVDAAHTRLSVLAGTSAVSSGRASPVGARVKVSMIVSRQDGRWIRTLAPAVAIAAAMLVGCSAAEHPLANDSPKGVPEELAPAEGPAVCAAAKPQDLCEA